MGRLIFSASIKYMRVSLSERPIAGDEEHTIIVGKSLRGLDIEQFGLEWLYKMYIRSDAGFDYSFGNHL